MKYMRNLSSSVFLCATLSSCISATKAPEAARNDIYEQFSAKTIETVFSYAVRIEVLSTIKKDDPNNPMNLEVKRFVGTGVPLPDNYVLTVAHVLPPPMTTYKDLTIINTVVAGNYTAKVIKVAPQKELALLQAEDCPEKGCFDSYFDGKIAAAMNIGEVVAVVGYPNGEKILSKGFISGRMIFNDQTYTLINKVSTTESSSGSPVFLFQNGEPLLGALIVGVFIDDDERLKNVNKVLVTPVEDIRGFLTGVKGLEQHLDKDGSSKKYKGN